MSSLFHQMEEFTLFDGLVPSDGLLGCGPVVEDIEQFDAGLEIPGDSLAKNDVIASEELFQDLLPTESVEDNFSEEWMETMDLSSFLQDAISEQPLKADEQVVSKTGNSRLLEELLTQPIKIKSSPTVSKNEQLYSCKGDNTSVKVQTKAVDTEINKTENHITFQEANANSILEEAINEIEGLDVLFLNQQLQELYNSSISSTESIETTCTSPEESLIKCNEEFLTASPLSTEDIDSILSSSEPASPNSVQDDPDYNPYMSEDTTCKKSRKSSKGNKTRHSPYDKTADKADKKERKRQQNRNAAIRYREKKRQERGNIHTEEDSLLARNKELKTKVEQLSNEISYMKSLISEVCEARGLKIQFK